MPPRPFTTQQVWLQVTILRNRAAGDCQPFSWKHGEGAARVQAAREILDRGYGKVPEPAAEPYAYGDRGMGIESFRKPNGNGSTEPVRLEDFQEQNRPMI